MNLRDHEARILRMYCRPGVTPIYDDYILKYLVYTTTTVVEKSFADTYVLYVCIQHEYLHGTYGSKDLSARRSSPRREESA